ncbi:hypothetical protein TNCV_3391431 [Trichonephila clavipes]|nr:hypothetical protein TNCV_3391431 [Trichonephila clavipes]
MGSFGMTSWASHEFERTRESVLRDSITFKAVIFSIFHAIADNSSGTRLLEGPSEGSPFLPEPIQLR